MEMRDDVFGGQINLQKGLTGTVNLLQYLRTGLRTGNLNKRTFKSFILCLQEPPTGRGGVIGFGAGVNLFFDRSTTGQRAAILASKDIPLWLDPTYSNADMVTCLWQTAISGRNDSHKDVYITSVYMDITHDRVIPPLLEKLVRFCTRSNKELIVCADTNSHSSLWGSNETL